MTDTLPDVPSSRPAAKRAGLPRIVVILLVGLVAIVVEWFSPLGLQKRNLILAQRHADLIMPLIHADPRFQKVRLQVFTGRDGCLSAGGVVKSKADLDAFIDLVASSKPPVLTMLRVYIQADETDKPPMLRLLDIPAYQASRTFL